MSFGVKIPRPPSQSSSRRTSLQNQLYDGASFGGAGGRRGSNVSVQSGLSVSMHASGSGAGGLNSSSSASAAASSNLFGSSAQQLNSTSSGAAGSGGSSAGLSSRSGGGGGGVRSRSVGNPTEILSRFNETQQKFDSEQNLKQADRLQQRLMWKEQVERSAALESQFAMNKKTVLNLEKQMESLKRELASERATFDTDLGVKEGKLEDAKNHLRSRKSRYDATMEELRDSRAAIARMRATLVENFICTKTFSARPDPENPFSDPSEDDFKTYKVYAPELQRRHQVLVERYVGSDPGSQERIFGADPLAATKGAGKKWKEKVTRQQYAHQMEMEQQRHEAQLKEEEERKKLRKKGAPKALAEVKQMLLSLEAEILETEIGEKTGRELVEKQQQQQTQQQRSSKSSSKTHHHHHHHHQTLSDSSSLTSSPTAAASS